MYLGKIMEIGPAEAVIRTPRHPYTQALVVASRPTPEPPERRGAGEPRRSSSARRPTRRAIPSGCRFHPRCPVAFERCSVEEPPLFDVGAGQQAACWLAEGGRELPMFGRGGATAVAAAPASAPAAASTEA